MSTQHDHTSKQVVAERQLCNLCLLQCLALKYVSSMRQAINAVNLESRGRAYLRSMAPCTFFRPSCTAFKYRCASCFLSSGTPYIIYSHYNCQPSFYSSVSCKVNFVVVSGEIFEPLLTHDPTHSCFRSIPLKSMCCIITHYRGYTVSCRPIMIIQDCS